MRSELEEAAVLKEHGHLGEGVFNVHTRIIKPVVLPEVLSPALSSIIQ